MMNNSRQERHEDNIMWRRVGVAVGLGKGREGGT